MTSQRQYVGPIAIFLLNHLTLLLFTNISIIAAFQSSTSFRISNLNIKEKPTKSLPFLSGITTTTTTTLYNANNDVANNQNINNSNEMIQITIPPLPSPPNLPTTNTASSPLHSIYIQPSFFTPQQTSHILSLAQKYADETNCWSNKDEERHSTYATTDFPIEDCTAISNYFNEEIHFQDKMFGLLADLYGLEKEGLSFEDLFCVQYQAKDDGIENSDNEDDVMDQLEPHRDGSLLSFTILLSSPSTDFQGGGTSFDALRDVSPSASHKKVLHNGGIIRPQLAGDAVLHSGKLLHGADVVASGTRVVLVGFVEVGTWCMNKEYIPMATREWGRCDVMSFRYRRQYNMTTKRKKAGWTLTNGRWLSSKKKRQGRSYIQGYVPAFSSVVKRGDYEYQRRKKLQVEYWLLQNILLPKEERYRENKIEEENSEGEANQKGEEVWKRVEGGSTGFFIL